jgi:hypothetical protein
VSAIGRDAEQRLDALVFWQAAEQTGDDAALAAVADDPEALVAGLVSLLTATLNGWADAVGVTTEDLVERLRAEAVAMRAAASRHDTDE